MQPGCFQDWGPAPHTNTCTHQHMCMSVAHVHKVQLVLPGPGSAAGESPRWRAACDYHSFPPPGYAPLEYCRVAEHGTENVSSALVTLLYETRQNNRDMACSALHLRGIQCTTTGPCSGGTGHMHLHSIQSMRCCCSSTGKMGECSWVGRMPGPAATHPPTQAA
jgi:hypothetical protein